MALNLLKLCVGVETVAELKDWQDRRIAEQGEIYHRTSQTPRRREELLDGGSLYWVIKGVILVRQPILDLQPGSWDDGRPCCKIVYAPELIATRPQPRRAFQGWRYLEGGDAPADAARHGFAEEQIPFKMAADLRELCLIDG